MAKTCGKCKHFSVDGERYLFDDMPKDAHDVIGLCHAPVPIWAEDEGLVDEGCAGEVLAGNSAERCQAYKKRKKEKHAKC